MCIETLYAKSLDELDRFIDEFTTGRITYDVNYREVGLYWQANVFYDDILEGGENL
ncbi:MAG: hypothetical protein K2J44_04760 [Ruminococcus sp.]|nr:hypothetical protein [Ruminococcus sp.]